MEKGRVRWYNKHFGYGFITHWDGRDVFVHHSVISIENVRDLQENQVVRYACDVNGGRLRATKVELYVPKEHGNIRRSTYSRYRRKY